MEVICPKCKTKHSRLESKVQIQVLSRAAPMPTTEGITFGIGPLSGYSELNTKTTIVELICPSCGYTGPIDTWEVIFSCFRCKKRIEVKKDINTTVALHYCRELHNTLHPECFSVGDYAFCKGCIYADSCKLFSQVMKLKKKKPRRKT